MPRDLLDESDDWDLKSFIALKYVVNGDGVADAKITNIRTDASDNATIFYQPYILQQKQGLFGGAKIEKVLSNDVLTKIVDRADFSSQMRDYLPHERARLREHQERISRQ